MKITDKSFKSFRETGTSLLFDSEYAAYEDVYLSHKGAKLSAIHYRAHPEARFTLALNWLGEQMPFSVK